MCGRINQQSSENWRSEAGMQRTHLRIELQHRWEPEMRHLGKVGHGASITLSPACLEYAISYSACHFTAVTFSSWSFQKKTGLAPKEDLPQSSAECPPLAGLSLPAVRLLVLMNWSHNKVRTTQGQFSTGFLSTVLIPLAFRGALNQKHTSNGWRLNNTNKQVGETNWKVKEKITCACSWESRVVSSSSIHPVARQVSTAGTG